MWKLRFSSFPYYLPLADITWVKIKRGIAHIVLIIVYHVKGIFNCVKNVLRVQTINHLKSTNLRLLFIIMPFTRSSQFQRKKEKTKKEAVPGTRMTKSIFNKKK